MNMVPNIFERMNGMGCDWGPGPYYNHYDAEDDARRAAAAAVREAKKEVDKKNEDIKKRIKYLEDNQKNIVDALKLHGIHVFIRA